MNVTVESSPQFATSKAKNAEKGADIPREQSTSKTTLAKSNATIADLLNCKHRLLKKKTVAKKGRKLVDLLTNSSLLMRRSETLSISLSETAIRKSRLNIK